MAPACLECLRFGASFKFLRNAVGSMDQALDLWQSCGGMRTSVNAFCAVCDGQPAWQPFAQRCAQWKRVALFRPSQGKSVFRQHQGVGTHHHPPTGLLGNRTELLRGCHL